MSPKSKVQSPKSIIIDARIRRSSTGRYVDRLIEHLQNIDTENHYTVLTQPTDDWQPVAQNFRRADAPYGQFSFSPLQQIKFAKQLKKLKPDLVHFPMNQQPVFYRGIVVTSTMDLTMLRFTRPGKTPLPIFWLKMIGYKYLFRSSVNKSKAIITISEFVKNDLEHHYPDSVGKITVTYCASEPPVPETAIFPTVLASKFHLQSSTFQFLLHVGSPFPHKNIERLIEAFEILVTERPELKLVLAGKREHYFEQLQKQIDASPARDNIVVTGFIPDAQLKWLYQNASVYVLPSLSEGFGLPGLEAMAHGCPVVSSNATCLPEVYEDAAHYFDPLSTQDMAIKINEVLTDESLRSQLIANGHQQLKKYSWPRMAQQTLKVYEQVLGK